jgi:RHS repeat-associated protein
MLPESSKCEISASLSATTYSYHPWWQLDLASSQFINSINLSPRTDCCPEMFSNAYLFVSDQPFTSTDLSTTLAQPGVSSYLMTGNTSAATTINVNRTGRYIRVQRSDTQYLVLAEVQVWGQQSTAAADVEWMVTDQLGTPRIVIDQSGSLSGVKRHDYLPFGEELYAGTGGRTSSQGYTGDAVRQKFTSKERDSETGLDYFGARYYSSAMGRFTSADPLYLEVGRLSDPQQWNIYMYARNNPLVFIDPHGLDVTVVDKTTDGSGANQYKQTLNGRKGGKFLIGYDKNGGVIIVDAKGNALGKDALKALGKSLSGSEKGLFTAITDTKNHATIDLVRKDGNVDFGRFDGNGKNTIDLGDLDVLDKAENVGFTSAQVIGHETLEAYAAATGLKEGASHNFANGLFPGLDATLSTNYAYYGGLIYRSISEIPIHNSSTHVKVTKELVTPIPYITAPGGAISPVGKTTPSHIIGISN